MLPNLQPGAYEMTVGADGFAPVTQRLQVRVGSRNSINIALGLAAPAANQPADPNQNPRTPAVIEGSEIAVDLTAQTLSTVITEKQIRDLPTLTRNPYDLVALSGNVSPGDPNRGVGLSINGQRASSVNFLHGWRSK